MVEPTKSNGTATNGSCSANGSFHSFQLNSNFQKNDFKKFNWTEEEQGLLLGSFFYGYTVSVGILGLTADIVGARYLISASLGGSAILSLFYPLFANFGFGWLVGLRTLQGAIQGNNFEIGAK